MARCSPTTRHDEQSVVKATQAHMGPGEVKSTTCMGDFGYSLSDALGSFLGGVSQTPALSPGLNAQATPA